MRHIVAHFLINVYFCAENIHQLNNLTMKKFTFALMALLAFTFSLKAQQYVSTQPSNRNVILVNNLISIRNVKGIISYRLIVICSCNSCHASCQYQKHNP